VGASVGLAKQLRAGSARPGHYPSPEAPAEPKEGKRRGREESPSPEESLGLAVRRWRLPPGVVLGSLLTLGGVGGEG